MTSDEPTPHESYIITPKPVQKAQTVQGASHATFSEADACKDPGLKTALKLMNTLIEEPIDTTSLSQTQLPQIRQIILPVLLDSQIWSSTNSSDIIFAAHGLSALIQFLEDVSHLSTTDAADSTNDTAGLYVEVARLTAERILHSLEQTRAMQTTTLCEILKVLGYAVDVLWKSAFEFAVLSKKVLHAFNQYERHSDPHVRSATAKLLIAVPHEKLSKKLKLFIKDEDQTVSLALAGASLIISTNDPPLPNEVFNALTRIAIRHLACMPNNSPNISIFTLDTLTAKHSFDWQAFCTKTIETSHDDVNKLNDADWIDPRILDTLGITRDILLAHHHFAIPNLAELVGGVLSLLVVLELSGSDALFKDVNTIKSQIENAFVRCIDIETISTVLNHCEARLHEPNSKKKDTLIDLISRLVNQAQAINGITLTHHDIEALLVTCSSLLKVPDVFSNDLESFADSKGWDVINKYRSSIPRLFRLARALLSISTADTGEVRWKESVIYDWVLHSAVFWADRSKRWVQDEAQRQEFDEFIAELFILWRRNDEVLYEDFIIHFGKKFLEREVKPYFKDDRVDEEGKKSRKQKSLEDKDDERSAMLASFKNQPWKSQRVECVEILEWVVYNSKAPHMSGILHLIVPAILVMMDDYDPKYKCRGIKLLLHGLLQNTSRAELRQTGLGKVFFSALKACFAFHSEPYVVEAALAAATEFAKATEVKRSKPYYERLEAVMEEGILRGLTYAIGGKLDILRIILSAIAPLADAMNLLTVQYLKPLLERVLEVLEGYQNDYQTQIICIHALEAIIANTWPRMPSHCPVILKACLVAWRAAVWEEEDEARRNSKVFLGDSSARSQLKELLRDIVDVLVELGDDEFKDAIDLVIETDSELFLPLFKRAT